MEQNSLKPMTPFDQLVTPSFLYSLKLLLPYTPKSLQQFLAVYIKVSELHYTIKHFQGFPSDTSSGNILESLKPFMNPSEKEMMEQMSSMMNMMDMVQNMQGILDPEQQEMFDMYNAIFETKLNTPGTGNEKGVSDDE